MANEMKILITGDASNAMGVLSAFSQTVKGATGEVEGHFSSLTKVVDDFATPVLKITALLGGGALFKSAIDGAVGFSKEVGGLQRLMGGTAQQASVTAIAVHSVFGDVDTYENAASKLVKTLNKSEGAITALGVKTRDAHGNFRDMNILLPEVVQSLSQYAAGTDRDAAAQAIFGRSFKEMLKFAAMTPEVMEEARKKAQELGLELDKQSQGTIKAYRKGMVDVDEAFLGLKTRVALEVMPGLTSLANWFSGVAPAAINLVGGFLRGLGDALGSLPALVGLAAVGFKVALLPAITGTVDMVMRFNTILAAGTVPTISAMGVQVAATSTRMGNLGTAVMGFLSPWMLVVAAVVGGALAVDYFSKAHERALKKIQETNSKTAKSTEEWVAGTKRVVALEEDLKNAKGTEERAKAQERLDLSMKSLLAAYPDLADFLVMEKGHQVGIAEAIERANAARLTSLRIQLAESEATEKKLHAGIDTRKGWNAAGEAEPKNLVAAGGDASEFIEVAPHAKEMQFNREQIAGAQKALELQEETTKGVRDQLIVLTAIGAEKEGKHWQGAEPKEKNDTFQQDLLRLQREGLQIGAKRTLEAERLNEVELLGSKRQEELNKIQDKEDKGKAKGGYSPEEAAQARLQAEENYANGRMALWDKFAQERTKMEADLQGKLTAAEEGGLDKRLEAIRADFVQRRETNRRLALEDKNFMTDEAVQAAQDAAEARAYKDQVQADLSKLKKELSELAQISGGKLSDHDTGEVLTRWKTQGGTKADAAGTYGREAHIGESGAQGAKAGMDAFLAQSENAFTKWKGFTTSIIGGAQSSIAGFFGSILQHGQTAGQKWDALWKGMSGSVIKAGSDMAAQEVVHWGVEKARALWKTAANAKEEAELMALMNTKLVTETGKTAATNAGAVGAVAADEVVTTSAVVNAEIQAGAAETSMAAKIYAWYASMGPWAIPAAAVTIAGVIAAIGAIAGREKGGDVQAGTPYIVGEAGHELFVPNVSGTIVPHDVLTSASRNLSANLGAHQNQVNRLQTQAGSYGAQAVAQGGGMGRGDDYRGAIIVATNSREWAEMVQKGNKTWGQNV
jgi:hypothetical protein